MPFHGPAPRVARALQAMIGNGGSRGGWIGWSRRQAAGLVTRLPGSGCPQILWVGLGMLCRRFVVWHGFAPSWIGLAILWATTTPKATAAPVRKRTSAKRQRQARREAPSR